MLLLLSAAQASNTPVASPWLVIPPAAIMMLVMCFHIDGLLRSRHRSRRRRIRLLNGFVLLALAPLLVLGFCYVHAGTPRLFVAVWGLIFWLIGVTVMFACMDSFITIRRRRLVMQRRRRALRDRLAGDLRTRTDGKGA